MSSQSRGTKRVVLVLALALTGPVTAFGQRVDESFDSVTGTGGGTVLDGAGFGLLPDWDDGIFGETAFGGTVGNAHALITAQGGPTAGVGGTGAGVISVSDVNFNLLDERFGAATGTGGGVFLAPNGQPDTFHYTTNWDDGLSGEGAFAGTFGGAILVGGASAQATLGTGNPAPAGQIIVDNVNVGTGGWYAGLQWDAPGLPGEVRLANPGFDDTPELAGWTEWGVGWNVLAELATNIPVTPLSGTRVLKMFGQFSGAYNTSGVYQDLIAQPGQTWELDAFVQHVSSDSLVGRQNYVTMGIEFYDAANTLVGSNNADILNSSSPTDQWIDLTPLQATAPAGTVRARAVFTFVQPLVGEYEGGAGLVEDVTFTVTAGPPAIDLSRFSLLADVRGLVNTGAGEQFGHYQLRLEDPDGDRLTFHSPAVASGTWTTIGGALSSAVEENADGQAASGVFDADAASFRAVVAFDNDVAPTWGTGGTLEVDNLRLTNEDPAGSSWYAGTFWDNLPAYAITDPARLMLTADVKGSVPGGQYDVRMEAFRIVPGGGIDEDFETVTGAGGGQILAPGGTQGESANWDNGIEGERAFAGTWGGATVFGGVTVQGTTTGGAGGGGAGMIAVDEISYSLNSGWYAVLAWPDQTLGSTDLSQVVLTADIRGTFGGSGQSPGLYQLRIEDPQGDYLAFEAVADGNWQLLGGPLSDADTNGSLDGGDGTFNTDGTSYTVAVAFESAGGWNWGGTLYVDNLFLTEGPPQMAQVGTISFPTTANGTFQSVGGLLSTGESTFPKEGGEFWAANGSSTIGGLPWDAGIEGEQCFAGTWSCGDPPTMATVTAQGCKDCGVGGGGGGQLIVTGLQYGTCGGWWAGVTWPVLDVDLSDLSQVSMTADIKGEGLTLSTMTLRIEDPNIDFLAFDLVANGSWQSIGGPLSTAVEGGTGDSGTGSDYVFDPNAATHSVVIILAGYDAGQTWLDGASITFDNLSLTVGGTTIVLDENFETVVSPIAGRITGVDSYTVTVTMVDGVETWGTTGTLTVDNVLFTPVAVSCDSDADVDLVEFALMQTCLGAVAAPECECVDVDADGDVDTDDYVILSRFLTGP